MRIWGLVKAVVVAVAICSLSACGDDNNDQPAIGVPAAPTNVTAVGGTNQITVTWNSVANALAYNVYRSTSSGVTPANGTKFATVSSPYVQTGLAASTVYFYVVTAVNLTGESAPSAQVSASTAGTNATVPAAPTGVAVVGAANQATVSWNAVAGATSYNVYRATTAGVTTANGTKFTNVTSPLVQTGLADATTYFYIVTAVNGAGESTPSTEVSGTTTSPTPTVPTAPTGVVAVGGTGQTSLSWNPVASATSYNVYRGTSTGVTPTTGTKFANATSPLVQTGLAEGSYFYVVTAVNAAGESTPSSEVTAAVTAALNGPNLYQANCAGCHNSLATSTKRMRTAAQIQAAIVNNVGGMGILSTLTPAQVQAIADALNF